MTPSPRIYVAFDFETTGLSAVDDRIVEVGAVKFNEAGEELAVFERLVNPGRSSSPRARAVHGISDGELAAAQPARVVIPEFVAFLAGAEIRRIMAHNASFDAAFFGAELARIGLAPPPHAVLDTLPLARRKVRLHSHRLDVLAHHFGLDPDGPHRALADSRRVMGLWRALGAEAALVDLANPTVYPIHDPSGPMPAPEGWDGLAQAVKRGWKVRLVYEGGTRGDAPREITPMRFVQRGGFAYVASFCHVDAKEKEFRLDRVRSYEVVVPL